MEGYIILAIVGGIVLLLISILAWDVHKAKRYERKLHDLYREEVEEIKKARASEEQDEYPLTD